MFCHRFAALAAASTLALAGVAHPAATAAPSSALPDTARVNARWTPVTDAAGRVWAGRSGFNTSANRSDGLRSTDVVGTDDDVLYQANLFGVTGWSTPLATGTYRVRLLMAEDYHTLPSRRVFDVSAEGRTVLTGVDIVAGAGARHRAYDRSFEVAVSDGRLDLGFVARADKALVSAIEVVPAPPTPTPSPTPTPAVSAMTFSHDHSGGGLAPLRAGTSWLFRAGAGDSRSEVFWGTQEAGRICLQQGTTVTAEFDLKHRFTNPVTGAKPSPRTWHTIFQLHGPVKAGGVWPTPPLTIAWQDGTYRIGGGAAVPDAQGGTVPMGSWYRPYLPSPEDTWEKIKVQAYLDGPGRGWVSVWVNDKLYIDRWKPVGGTMYTNSGNYSHKEINLKSGLYTGTDSPDWTRWAEQRNMKVSWTGPQGEGRAAL